MQDLLYASSSITCANYYQRRFKLFLLAEKKNKEQTNTNQNWFGAPSVTKYGASQMLVFTYNAKLSFSFSNIFKTLM